MAKFSFKDHPVVVVSSVVGATLILCFAVLIPLHSMVVEKKDGTIETKQATIDSLKEDNDMLRRRLQGEIVLVSTNDLRAVEEKLVRIEAQVSDKTSGPATYLSQLSDIRNEMDKSVNQVSPQAFIELRRVANIRPSGVSVNWMSGTRAGPRFVGPSSLMSKLNEAFDKFNSRDSAAAASLFTEITSAEPRWPYAYFYLALNALNAKEAQAKPFEDAANHFENIRKVGIIEPELLLYESMTRAFLGQFDTARYLLKKLSEFNDKVEEITVLVAGKSWPPDILERLQSIADKSKIPIVMIDPAAK